MIECSGMCHTRPKTLGNSRSGYRPLPRTKPDYLKGDKYCTICAATWRGYNGLRCPCCTVMLRTTPRGAPERRAFHERGGWRVAREASLT